jgi:hypothetical protein
MNTLPSSDPLDSLLRLVRRLKGGVGRGVRPALPGQVDLGRDAPLTGAMLGAIGFASGTFSVANNSSDTLDLGNLSTAAGPAVEGVAVFYDLKRGQDDSLGHQSRHATGLLLIAVRYWNGSGAAFMNQLGSVEDASHPAGVSFSVGIVSDRLQLTIAADNSGDATLGQYRLFPWTALSPTAP